MHAGIAISSAKPVKMETFKGPSPSLEIVFL